MSAFYVAAYGSLSIPAILAGVVASYLSLQETFEIFGSVVAAIGLVVAFEAWRSRPVSAPRRPNRQEVLLDAAS
jgi:membrane protein implicated in regulation of membrane protease activity